MAITAEQSRDLLATAASQLSGGQLSPGARPPAGCVVAIYRHGTIVAYPTAYPQDQDAQAAAQRRHRHEPTADHFVAFATGARIVVRDLVGAVVAVGDDDPGPRDE